MTFFCPHCGKPTLANAKFCVACGLEIKTGLEGTSSSSNQVSNASTSFGRVPSFVEFVKKKNSADRGHAKKSKMKRNDKDEEVNIKLGLMEWIPEDGILKKKYGKRTGLKVSKTASYAVILEKAVEKWKFYRAECYEEDERYVLLLANGKEAIFLPGPAKEFFTLQRYKEEMHQDFKDIVLYLCTENDFRLSEGLEVLPLSGELDDGGGIPEIEDDSLIDLKRRRESSDTNEDLAKRIQLDRELAEQLQEIENTPAVKEIESVSVVEETLEDEAKKEWHDPADVVSLLQTKVCREEHLFVSVRRGTTLSRILRLWQYERGKKNINPCSVVYIRFLGENGIDDGALAKEFFTDAVAQIGETLFPSGRPLDSTLHIQNGNFRASGEIIATSLAQGGPPPCFLEGCTFEALVNPNLDLLTLHPKDHLTTQEQELIESIKTDVKQHTDTILEHGYTGRIDKDHVNDIVRSITVSLVCKRILYLKEFRKGLELYGLLQILERSPEACRPLFVSGMQDKVDAAYLFSLLCPEFSPKQTARRAVEEQMMDDFQDLLLDMEQGKVAPVSYVQEHKGPGNEGYKVEEARSPTDLELFGKVELTPAGVMGWLTGQKHRAVNEDKIKIMACFDHDCISRNPKHSICFPVVRSCGREIIFPVAHMKGYDEFKNTFCLAFSRGQAFGNA